MMFTGGHVGCWIDGAAGLEYSRAKLSGMMQALDETEIAEALLKPPSDDDWELDAAVDALQRRTEDGLEWVWENGDLLLVEGE